MTQLLEGKTKENQQKLIGNKLFLFIKYYILPITCNFHVKYIHVKEIK